MEVQFDEHCGTTVLTFAMLIVNKQSYLFTSSEDVSLAGVQGMVATGFTWQKSGLRMRQSEDMPHGISEVAWSLG